MQPTKPQHQYATRTRHNVEIRPSQRLRQSPEPITSLTPRPTPTATNSKDHAIPFPPPHIVLHPDDANSRVFLAIGRSFMSVDNRAMTIKDLSEMTIKFGLACQNVSAASQAITTYIRSHMQRCEVQQDTPLLLKHTLSGTASDDGLLPALYSRSGGAHCTSNPENRVTNFRRGTMVWYLSRATGAPCPFARAGIRLCDYSDFGRQEQKKAKREMGSVEHHCGQKRKRLLRTRPSRGDDDSDSCPEDAQRPPKVKLTLRLKLKQTSPSEPRHVIDITHSSDSDESMSDVDSSSDEEEESKPKEEEPWSLPPYPRRSISIPSYKPSLDSFSSYPYYSDPPSTSTNQFCRSPSVPYSIGSPPPDSEDEDDFHIAMTRTRTFSADGPSTAIANDWDHEPDSEGDGETLWESPGPRSPSAPAPLIPHADVSDVTVTVKQEPRDVQSMLDAWEDYDSFAASDVKNLPIATASTNAVKLEPSSLWNWDTDSQEWFSPLLDDPFSASPPSMSPEGIKQEDMDFDNLLAVHSPLSSADSSFSDDSPAPTQPNGIDERQVRWDDEQFPTIRGRIKISPVVASTSSLPPLPQPLRLEMPSQPYSPASSPTPLLGALSPDTAQSPTLTTLASLIQSMSMSSPTAVSPAALRISPSSACGVSNSPTGLSPSTDIVVVHTCQPCSPTVSATQVEGISVYQTMLGSTRLLRRIDTDFVNISPIAAYIDSPLPTISTAVVVNKGSAVVSGTWVPLSAAQSYVQSCLAAPPSSSKLFPAQRATLQTLLNIFLSDALFERFPSALQDFHRSSTSGRMLNQFGPHFASTLAQSIADLEAWQQQQSQTVYADQALSLPPSLSWISRGGIRKADSAAPIEDLPLSPSEQEIFQALCANPEWEQEVPPAKMVNPVEGSAIPHLIPEASTQNSDPPSAIAASSPSGDKVEPLLPTREELSVHTYEANPTSLTLPSAKDTASEQASPSEADRPLRRSKRVANAIAAKTQTRSRRRGSTKALS